MTRWADAAPVQVPSDLHAVVQGHHLVAEALLRRGIATPDAARAFLDPAIYRPASPFDLPGMTRAVERIHLAIRRDESIAVWGDFDADGQTATAILFERLRSLGARVQYRVPTRSQGHGLPADSVGDLADQGVQVLITCDTGITAHTAAGLAAGRGLDLLITDHHVPDSQLPPAYAVVNPHLLPTGHPKATLSGAGVAYEMAFALDGDLADLSLDIAALGTIADVATLTGDCRYLAQRGLLAIRESARPGLLAICEAAGIHPEGITEEHVGYVLGPRLNALGRLADAAHGITLLTTSERLVARNLAGVLEGLNSQRQRLTQQVAGAALAQIAEHPSLLNDHAALVLSHAEWPAAVVGVVAGQLAERFARPVALIAAPPGQVARASARSVPGVDLVAALRECAALLEQFGGHRGAAGFSLAPDRIPELRAALSRAVSRQAPTVPERTITIDGYVELSELTLGLVAELTRLAPFGSGNPPLVLGIRDLRVRSDAFLGLGREHRRVVVEDAQERRQAVAWWQGGGYPLPAGQFDLAVTVRASDYRGSRDVQVTWVDARSTGTDVVEVSRRLRPTLRDLRREAYPEEFLRTELREGYQVWAEGESPADILAQRRHELGPGRILVVWTLPPGPQELVDAVERVRPEEVWLFAQGPGVAELPAFLQQLGGMVKSALHSRAGRLSLDRVASALGHRVAAVAAGVEWLVARGQVRLLDKDTDGWRLGPGDGKADLREAALALSRLEAVLAETAAFRDYMRTAPADSLLAN